MHALVAAVHYDLTAVEMRVAERRRNVNDAARRVAIGHLGYAGEALHTGQRKGEKGRVHRTDHQRVIAEKAAARLEWEQYERLSGEPCERLGAQHGKIIAEALAETRLVAW